MSQKQIIMVAETHVDLVRVGYIYIYIHINRYIDNHTHIHKRQKNTYFVLTMWLLMAHPT